MNLSNRESAPRVVGARKGIVNSLARNAAKLLRTPAGRLDASDFQIQIW